MLPYEVWMLASCIPNVWIFVCKVYLILEEFVLAGELQESSKKVILERLRELDRIET